MLAERTKPVLTATALALLAATLAGCEVEYTDEGGMEYTYEQGDGESTIDPVLEQYGRSVAQTLDSINDHRANNGLAAFSSYDECASKVVTATATGTSLDGLGGAAQHERVTLMTGDVAATYKPIDLGYGTLTVYQC